MTDEAPPGGVNCKEPERVNCARRYRVNSEALDGKRDLPFSLTATRPTCLITYVSFRLFEMRLACGIPVYDRVSRNGPGVAPRM